MIYRQIYFFLLLLTSVTIGYGQDRKIELEIIGCKTYDNLYIRSFQPKKKPVRFAGESVDGIHWTFTIPDSVAKKTCNFDFRWKAQKKTEINNSVSFPTDNFISFLSVIQGDTLKGNYFNFENNERLIRLKVKYHHTAHEYNRQYDPSLKKTVTIQEWDEDYFFIDSIQNHYLKENMTDLSFGFQGYDDAYPKIKKNPNSQYYLTRIAMTSDYYKPKDLAQLYYLFPDEMQRSYFGQIIYKDFSTFEIANASLQNCKTQKDEKIVADSSKYTLLIFSASWCGPCHKKIPMLKRIYNEMNNALDMVYITVDEENKISQWNKLMQKENISWRSLSINSSSNSKELIDAWQIGSIPDYILINPNLKAQKIKLNDENDIHSLYSMIQNK